MSFTQMGLSKPALASLTHVGIENPTQIQSEAIPYLLEGRDLMGIAQTGTGKTLAFALPALEMLHKAEIRRPRGGTSVLIMSPTRELAAQIMESLKALPMARKFAIGLIIGGAPMFKQKKALAGGLDIIVATPGRLIDHMESGTFTGVYTQFVVLDEADQMLDMGFIPAIKQIMADIPKDRQTAMFSATMPKAIKKFAHEVLQNEAEVEVTPVSSVSTKLKQKIISLPLNKKIERLKDVMSGLANTKVVAFTRTKRRAEMVARQLDEIGHTVYCIHGDKKPSHRKQAITGFTDTEAGILVATDIAARGIHVDDITHVINVDMPTTPEAYVHRIGRTARAGDSGVALSLCAPEEKSLLREIEKLQKTKLVPAEENDADLIVEGEPKKKIAPKKAHSDRFRADSSRGGDRSDRRDRSQGGPRRDRSERKGKNWDDNNRRDGMNARSEGRRDKRHDRRNDSQDDFWAEERDDSRDDFRANRGNSRRQERGFKGQRGERGNWRDRDNRGDRGERGFKGQRDRSRSDRFNQDTRFDQSERPNEGRFADQSGDFKQDANKRDTNKRDTNKRDRNKQDWAAKDGKGRDRDFKKSDRFGAQKNDRNGERNSARTSERAGDRTLGRKAGFKGGRDQERGQERGDNRQHAKHGAGKQSGGKSVRGTVKWYNGTKGFGFISPEKGGEDVFLHISAVERAGLKRIPEGSSIEYTLQMDKRRGKMSAEQLKML